MLLSVDPARASDPEVVGEGDRDRLVALVEKWSREDLLRGFDLLTRAEQEVRASEQPRYNLEMALLRLMHLRKLVPLTELLAGGGALGSGPRGALASAPARAQAPLRSSTPAARATLPARTSSASPGWSGSGQGSRGSAVRQGSTPRAVPEERETPSTPSLPPSAPYRDAFLAELKAAKPTFYNLVVAQAFSIEADQSGVVFRFQPNQKVPKAQCEEQRAWVQSIVERLTGARLPVQVAFTDAAAAEAAPAAPAPSAPVTPTAEGRTAALENETVRTLLEVFPVEKTSVDSEG